MLLIWQALELIFISELFPSFIGNCEDNSDDSYPDSIVSAQDCTECEEKCRKMSMCVAFSLDLPTVNDNCNLYKGGPYTHGNGKTGTLCYILPENVTSVW